MATTPTAPARGTAREVYGAIDVTTCSAVTTVTTVTTVSQSNAYVYNGATWEAQYTNLEVTVLASAARTATHNGADMTNYGARGVLLTLDVTAKVDTPTLTVKVQSKDSLSGKYVDIPNAAFAAKTDVSTDELLIYPGCPATANVSVNSALPRVWRVVCTHTDADSITYSIGAAYIL
jgi:hypothetical protein